MLKLITPELQFFYVTKVVHKEELIGNKGQENYRTFIFFFLYSNLLYVIWDFLSKIILLEFLFVSLKFISAG